VRLTAGEEGGATVVTVAGDVDLTSLPELKQRLIGELEGGARRLVVDLLGMTLLDSTVLGVLVGALKRARAADAQLALVVAPDLLTVFEITGLDRVFAIRPTRAAALAPKGRRCDRPRRARSGDAGPTRRMRSRGSFAKVGASRRRAG
jgi:anti-sigma B factor antagonist